MSRQIAQRLLAGRDGGDVGSIDIRREVIALIAESMGGRQHLVLELEHLGLVRIADKQAQLVLGLAFHLTVQFVGSRVGPRHLAGGSGRDIAPLAGTFLDCTLVVLHPPSVVIATARH